MKYNTWSILNLLTCLAPICVYTAPKLNKTQAFSNATVLWQDGTPVENNKIDLLL